MWDGILLTSNNSFLFVKKDKTAKRFKGNVWRFTVFSVFLQADSKN